MKNRRYGKELVAVGLLLIACSFLHAGWNFWEVQNASIASKQVLAQLIQTDQTVQNETEEADPAGEMTMVSPVSKTEKPVIVREETEIPDYVLDPTMAMPTQNVDGYDYIGVIRIPEINLELPIMDEWSYEGMRIAPGRYAGSAYTGDLVICAHYYEPHFGNLKYLDIDSEITFTDIDGNVFTYRVVDMEILPATAILEMVTGEWDLTLFTCALDRVNRVTIRCELV